MLCVSLGTFCFTSMVSDFSTVSKLKLFHWFQKRMWKKCNRLFAEVEVWLQNRHAIVRDYLLKKEII